MLIRYTLAWFGLMVIAILNGTLRQTTYLKVTSELTAHQISCATGITLFGAAIWYLSRIWPLGSAGQAWTVGLIWIGMTVCFEFVFGHYVMHHSWEKLFSDYNIFAGRLWILVLIWTTVAPYIFYKINR
ncbi:MAG: hypothetical protein NTW14_01970 [bacterium]|nr:hypothetical protein [bacterium]